MTKFLMMVAVVLLAACAGNGEMGDEYYRMDVNHDRALTRAELGTHYPPTRFNEMDIDGSGDVSPMEYRRHPNQNRNN